MVKVSRIVHNWLKPRGLTSPSAAMYLGLRYFFSLAERIKQFIPEDAYEPIQRKYIPQVPMKISSNVSSLSEHLSELNKCQHLCRLMLFSDAAALLGTFPLPVYSVALCKHILPFVLNGPLKELGAMELLYSIFCQNSDLFNQIYPDLKENLTFINPTTVNHFKVIQDLPLNKSYEEIDHLLQLVFNCKLLDVFNDNNNKWLQVRLLLKVDNRTIGDSMQYYRDSINSVQVALIILHSNLTVKKIIGNWLKLNRRGLESISLVVRDIETYKAVLKRLNYGGINILKCALRLGLSYDIANICHNFRDELSNKDCFQLIALALINSAFAQSHEPINKLTNGFKNELNTFLVRKILRPISTSAEINEVVGIAARILGNIFKNKVPANPLWKLIWSLPKCYLEVNGRAQHELAKLIVQRPYDEQLIYMARQPSCEGVFIVLKHYLRRIQISRDAHATMLFDLQSDEDIRHITKGLLIATEKIKGVDDYSKHIVNFFTQDHALTLDYSKKYYIADSLIVKILRYLIRSKSYIVAAQILQALAPHKTSKLALDSLLVSIAREEPNATIKILKWAIKVGKLKVSENTFNKLLMWLCCSSELSESQVERRFRSIQSIMLSHINKHPSSYVVQNMVELLLYNSLKSRQLNLKRLQWAFRVAEDFNVPEHVMNRWMAVLKEVHNTRLSST